MKSKFVALAVAATMGLGTVSAFAQTYHHDGRAAWQQRRAEEQARRDWAYNHRYYGPTYNYRRDDGDVAGALLLGALTGALVGQATTSNNYYTPPATYYAPPASYYTPPATYYTPPANYYAPPATYYNYGY